MTKLQTVANVRYIITINLWDNIFCIAINGAEVITYFRGIPAIMCEYHLGNSRVPDEGLRKVKRREKNIAVKISCGAYLSPPSPLGVGDPV